MENLGEEVEKLALVETDFTSLQSLFIVIVVVHFSPTDPGKIILVRYNWSAISAQNSYFKFTSNECSNLQFSRLFS